MTSKNVVVWFEIPVKNIQKAMTFYSKVMNVEFKMDEMAQSKMAMFPSEGDAAGGALVQSPNSTPSATGSLVYLNAGKDLSVPLAKVTPNGGKILQEKMSIGEYGYIATFEDCEGNRIGLWSEK